MRSYPQLMEPYTPVSGQQKLKKQAFIQNPTHNIKKKYDFSPKPIGQGYYGVVYQAKLKEPPFSDRVIKVVQKKHIRDISAIREEVQILKRIDHPNIVKLYQFYEDHLSFYLVLDLWSGGQLFDRVQQMGVIRQDEAKKLFRQMLMTVNYLHQHKICHRDLKPENFLFNKKNGDTLGLIDFGLAFQWQYNMSKELVKCKQNKMVGSAYYVAPEVIQKEYDQRCDIWSLGVTLYTLTTGTVPFQGSDDFDILKSIVNFNISKDDEFKNLSYNLKNLLNSIFVPKEQRPTISDLLNHPWVKEQDFTRPNLNFEMMQNFASHSKLKKLTLNFMASQLSASQTSELAEQFNQIDTHKDGVLTIDEIEEALRVQGCTPSRDELNKTLRHLDMNKSGKITYNEFLACGIQQQYCKKQDYLKPIFNYFNTDQTGSICLAELQDQVAKLGMDMPKRIGREIMRQADQDEDGVISYQQFLDNMSENSISSISSSPSASGQLGTFSTFSTTTSIEQFMGEEQ